MSEINRVANLLEVDEKYLKEFDRIDYPTELNAIIIVYKDGRKFIVEVNVYDEGDDKPL